ncbi:hypothetical protein [Nocardia flavorosea]|uniref:Tetracycline repressor TetR C-terminal domain-containing protein n=1 Tax=Nocardia flavorosea TaxID=53429 RepID=A0A846YQ71_9NOCA|nr:hypothetical protein [Nocardia flavorosea]NKY59861.1 hypothetical protein [Nocardia flavorosea]
MAAALELAGDRYPRLIEAISDHPQAQQPAECAQQRDAALEFGIDRILDGVAALLAQRTAR